MLTVYLSAGAGGAAGAASRGLVVMIVDVIDMSITIEKILPNLGAETGRLACFRRRVVVVATSAGGAAFNAALCAGERTLPP